MNIFLFCLSGSNDITNTVSFAASVKGIVQPFELGGETRLIRSAVKK